MKDYENHFIKMINSQYLRTEGYVSLIKNIFASSAKQFAIFAMMTGYDPSSGQFFFDNYPAVMGRVVGEVQKLANRLNVMITSATNESWSKGNAGLTRLVTDYMQKNGVRGVSTVKKGPLAKVFDNHEGAVEAFRQRSIKGLNLSDRVWDYANNARLEAQLAVSVSDALKGGKSAADLAEEIKHYLKNPSELYEKAADELGQFKMDKNSAEYGPGIYRDCIKNAERLARNEINNAYRQAENESYKQFPFVVGKEIHRSTYQDANGEPYNCDDICEVLKGKYPADFPFEGWHINCRCYEIPIMCSPEEMQEYTKALLDGEENPTINSVNEVKDIPDNFKGWISDNEERISKAEKRGTLPRFLETNKDVVEDVLGRSLKTDDYSDLPAPVRADVDRLLAGVEPGDPGSYDYSLKVLSPVMEAGFSDYVVQDAEVAQMRERLAELDMLTKQGSSEALEKEKLGVINSIRDRQLELTKTHLEESKLVTGLTFKEMQKGYMVNEKKVFEYDGKQYVIPRTNVDCVVYKDSLGKTYSYVAGYDRVDKLNAVAYSKMVKEFPRFMQDRLNGIVFCNGYNPLDEYYQKIYPRFTHAAMYSGKQVSVHSSIPIYDEAKRLLAHEIGHNSQDFYRVLEKTWARVMSQDSVAPSLYALNSAREDFAESFSHFITRPEEFKKTCPHRYKKLMSIFGSLL